MNTGVIVRIERERCEDRRDNRLATAWTGTESVLSPPGNGQALRRDDTNSAKFDFTANMPVLVMLGHEHPGGIRALLQAADAGARVYVLAPPGWGVGSGDPGLSERRKATVLVRRLASPPPACGVVCADTAQLWAGAAVQEPAPWRLQLDGDQAEAFRQVFLRLFWLEAVDEAWTGEGALAFRPARDRPFDIPEQAHSASVRLEQAGARWAIAEHSMVYLNPGSTLPKGEPERLWLPPSGQQHAELARLQENGTEIVGGNLQLPDLATTGQAGTLLLPGTHRRLRLTFNASQARDAQLILATEPAWRFTTGICLGDRELAEKRLWLDGSPSAAPLVPEQKMPVGEFQAENLRDMDNIQPSLWPAVQPLALQARYTWSVRPPRLPAGSEEDPLVRDWRRLDESYVERLGQARRQLEAAEHQRSRLGNTFARLLGSMLGFSRTQESLARQLAVLGQKKPSLEGLAAGDLLVRLAELETQLGKLCGDLEKTERQAEEDDEKDRQQKAWESRTAEARNRLAGLRPALVERERRFQEVREELALLKEQLAKPDAAASQERKDMQARQKRLGDEQQQLDKQINRSRSEIASQEKIASEAFEFKRKSQPLPVEKASKARFVPEASARRTSTSGTPPAEALPEVGTLRTCKKERYLVIDRWDDLLEGEKAAVRLNARLVAGEFA